MSRRVADAGERAVVELLRRALGVEGPGDDCAALSPELDDGEVLVASTDVVLSASHFPDLMTPARRGAYAAAVNLSDLAACGARPLGLLLAWGIPPDAELADVEATAKGAADLAARFHCPVLGGDTKPADGLLLAGFALGATASPMPRSAARVGETVCVTGQLGGAGLGAERWRRSRRGGEAGSGDSGGGPTEGAGDSVPTDAALDRFLAPAPRIAEGRALAKAGASACMDLSDGLAYSLHRVAEAAGVGFRIFEGDLPAFPGADDDHILFCGGDFELLCTLPEERVETAVEAVEAAGGTLTPIGEVAKDQLLLDGRPLPDRGFEHFARPMDDEDEDIQGP